MNQSLTPRYSYSEMSLILSCERRWSFYKTGIKGIIIPDDKSMIFGKSVHEAIQDYFMHILRTKITKEIEIETRARQSFYNNTELYKYYTDNRVVFERVVGNFIKFEKERFTKWKNFIPTFVEQRLEAGDLHGVIDVYFGEDRTLIDWKSYDATMISPSMTLQGAIYKVLLEENKFPVDKILFVFLESGRVLQLPKTTKGFVLEQMHRVKTIADSGVYRPNFSFGCRACPFVLDCNFLNDKLWDEED